MRMKKSSSEVKRKGGRREGRVRWLHENEIRERWKKGDVVGGDESWKSQRK